MEKVGGHAIVTFLANPRATDYSVWLCSSCWRCSESCPVGVDIHTLMMTERRRESAPTWYQAAYERILATGQALDMAQSDLSETRVEHGLEAVRLPPPELARELLSNAPESVDPPDEP